MASETKWAMDDDWEHYRPTITRLLVEEGKTAKQIMGIMQQRHDFHATIKMFQDHFDRWQPGQKEQQGGAASQSSSATANGAGAGSSPESQPSSKKWATQKDWETYRPIITRLYGEESKTLAQVTEIMEREHGFHATIKMYKTRFKRWGLWKNTRAADITDIILRKSADAEPAHADSYVFINGRYVEKRKVEAYIKRRKRQVIARLGEHRDGLTNFIEGQVSPPQSVDPPPEFRKEEYLYRAVHDYYSSRLSARRWTWKTPAQTEPGTAVEIAVAKRQSDFFERFRTAIPMLENPADQGAEGIKMLRICFAEVSWLLQSEDPMMLFCILAILYHIRRVGDKLHFLQVQLLRHMASVSAAMRHSTTAIWEALYEGVLNGTLDNHRSLQSCNVVTSQLDRALGLWHAKTVEWAIISLTFSDEGPEAKESRFRRVLAGLDSLGTFDERHAGIRMNLSAFYFRYSKYEESAAVILAIISDPEKDKVLRKEPFIAYKLWWRIGQIRAVQGNLDECETYLNEALKIARGLYEHEGEQSMLLDCLVSVEKCLRDQGKTAEADVALAERKAVLRDTLERVGEKEDSVTPAVAAGKTP